MACTAPPQPPRQAGLGVSGRSHRNDARSYISSQVAAPSSTSGDQQPSIRIVFPARSAGGAPNVESSNDSQRRMSGAARESEQVALATKRLRKWIKSFARVFDYRPETMSRLQAERQRWSAVGMGPVHIVNRGNPSSQYYHARAHGAHGQAGRPRRLRRQRDLVQRSDSGVSVRTLPRYKQDPDDSEMTLYKSERDETAEEQFSSTSHTPVVVDEPNCILQPGDAEEPASNQGDEGSSTSTRTAIELSRDAIENDRATICTESERRSELLDLFDDNVPAYSAIYRPPLIMVDSNESSHSSSRRNFRSLLRAPCSSGSVTMSRQRQYERETASEMAPRGRRLTSTSASRPSSVQSNNFDPLLRSESHEGGAATPSYPGRTHSTFSTASAPVTRNASLVSLLPLALQIAFADEGAASSRAGSRAGSIAGHDMQVSAPVSRRQSLTTSSHAHTMPPSARNVAALTAALHARHASLTAPVSGYSEQQLAFLATVDKLDCCSDRGGASNVANDGAVSAPEVA